MILPKRTGENDPIITPQEFSSHSFTPYEAVYMCRACGTFKLHTIKPNTPANYKVPGWCNIQCLNDHKAGKRAEKNLILTCHTCSKDYISHYSRGRHGALSKFCSHKCLGQKRSKLPAYKENNMNKNAHTHDRIDRLDALRDIAPQLRHCLVCPKDKGSDKIFCSVACSNRGRPLLFGSHNDKLPDKKRCLEIYTAFESEKNTLKHKKLIDKLNKPMPIPQIPLP